MSRRRLIHRSHCGLAVALICAASLACEHATAAPYPATPIPRVETGSHTDIIKKLSVGGSGRLLLTMSDDKTARVWSAQTGRLLRILRVPIVDGYEGQLYAGALSPDGSKAVVGGFAGMHEQGLSTLYFFDTASGAMTLRLQNLGPAAIENVAFSPDGRVLAACLAGGRGVLLFDLKTQALILRDAETTGDIHGAHFAPNGDFAISTYDGSVRLYRAASQYKDPVVRKLTAASRPMHVQFSPDGRELAVGFEDRPVFSILEARTLNDSYTATLPPQLKQRGLHAVEWSSDGAYLYAGGRMEAELDAPVYRFAERGRGRPEKVLTSTRLITDMRRLPDGALAFTSGEPEVGILEASGKVRWRLRSGTVDPRRDAARFLVSRTGDRVTFAESARASSFVFDALADPEHALQLASTRPEGLTDAQTESPTLKIETAREPNRLVVNGTTVPLDPFETVGAWAIAPGGRAVAVATRWRIRFIEANGAQRWATPMASDTGVINVTGDGQLVLASLSDGTVRWYRVEDGAEVLALFAHRNGRDWIAWIPPGYYTSSLSGDNYIGWHVNRGADRDPDFYRAVQFERLLYRPDVVRAYFRGRGKVDLQKAVGAGTQAFDIARLDAVAPPRLQITAAPAQGRANVRVTGAATALPMQDWTLFLNDIPITAARDRALTGGETQAFRRELMLDMPRRANRLRVESANGSALGIAEVDVNVDAPPRATPGDLYLVAAGTSDFVDNGIADLAYASLDASGFVTTLSAPTFAAGYRKVHSLLLADQGGQGRATRESFKRAADFLATAQGNDTVIVFLASHGLSDAKGNFFYVPADGKQSDVDALKRGADDAPSLLRWDFFVDLLRRTAGKRLLIVDTCSSGALGNSFDVQSLAKRSLSSSFALLAASKGNERSQEFPRESHGLFTYSLLEALRTGFDPNKDGRVSLAEAFEFAFDQVQALRNKATGPQTPVLNAPEALADMPLRVVPARAAKLDQKTAKS